MNELRTVARLAVGCLGFATLLMARIIYTGTPVYAFLLWNLLLALLPLLFAGLAVRARSRVLTAAFSLLWLLFLPNAPYLMTDLIHLRYGNSEGALALLDAVLLFSGALCGLALGLQSLRWMQARVAQRWGHAISQGFALAALSLSGFGIYLGRSLRWNSWDVLTQPRALLYDLTAHVVNPLAHWQAWVLSALFASVLVYAYWLMQAGARRAGE